jgi:hypothetical protein
MDDSENSRSNHGDDKRGKEPPWRRAQAREPAARERMRPKGDAVLLGNYGAWGPAGVVPPILPGGRPLLRRRTRA